MDELEERTKGFIACLYRLTQEGRENRGALADLRSGLGRAPGEAPRMHKHVVPFLGELAWPSDRWFYVVGALFAWHPRHDPGGSLGECFGGLRRGDGISDSAEARFVALLGSHPDDLPGRLREAIGLLRSATIAPDWLRLLRDLIQWDHPGRYVQLRWARDFYRPRRAPAKTVAA